MELLAKLTDGNVANFLLLFARLSAVLTFFPFFGNNLINAQSKAALAFFLTILFFPVIPMTPFAMNFPDFMIAIIAEATLGLIASLFLEMIFAALSFGGETISFAMGLTMANAFDPVSGSSKPIVGQLISLLALLTLLALDFHHLILYFVAKSLEAIPLGGFVLTESVIQYLLKAFAHMIVIGFTLAFPIVGLILLSDVIFGMIMKTNPQFNLLAIGFPVKITIAFAVLITIIPAIMIRFEKEIRLAFNALELLFQ